jgi:uncharacterized membrane protein YGL010W
MALVHGLLLGAAAALGQHLALAPLLGTGATLFVIGWALQFWGHMFEGRKPAFVDDLMGLIIGPLFLVAEAAFALGFKSALRAQVETAVGPMRVRTRDAVGT